MKSFLLISVLQKSRNYYFIYVSIHNFLTETIAFNLTHIQVCILDLYFCPKRFKRNIFVKVVILNFDTEFSVLARSLVNIEIYKISCLAYYVLHVSPPSLGHFCLHVSVWIFQNLLFWTGFVHANFEQIVLLSLLSYLFFKS